jgi:hypothetical protein
MANRKFITKKRVTSVAERTALSRVKKESQLTISEPTLSNHILTLPHSKFQTFFYGYYELAQLEHSKSTWHFDLIVFW